MKVFLATPTIADVTEFLNLVEKSHALHTPWVQPPCSEEKYIAYIKRISGNSHQGFFIKLNASNKIIGAININEIVRGGLQSGYLGFYAFSGFAGRGLMSEGLSLVLLHAFNNLGLHRLEANIQPDNIKSIAFIKKYNFRHEGFSPKYLKIHNKWRDHQRFALTIENYRGLDSND